MSSKWPSAWFIVSEFGRWTGPGPLSTTWGPDDEPLIGTVIGQFGTDTLLNDTLIICSQASAGTNETVNLEFIQKKLKNEFYRIDAKAFLSIGNVGIWNLLCISLWMDLCWNVVALRWYCNFCEVNEIKHRNAYASEWEMATKTWLLPVRIVFT